MTGTLLNLRREKKRRARAEADATAAANRLTFGTPRALRQQAAAETGRQLSRLDAHRLSGTSPPSDDEP